MAWPKEVTVVEDSDICRHGYSGPNGKHCSVGWLIADAPNANWEERWRFHDEYAREARSLGLRDADSGVLSINDNTRNPLRLIARVINRTWARLGYVVNNPECRKDGTLKPV